MNLKLLTLRPSLTTKVHIATCFVLSAHLLYKDVGRQAAHEISIIRSGRDSEASEVTGSNAPERGLGTDREVHPGSSAQSEVGVQNDSSSNSSKLRILSSQH